MRSAGDYLVLWAPRESHPRELAAYFLHASARIGELHRTHARAALR